MEFLKELNPKTKKIVAAVVIGLIVIFIGSKIFSGSDSKNTNIQASAENVKYELADNIQDGVILHCFNWKYNDIKAELKNIAAAGFTSIQTSPAQVSVSSGEWYYLYQPLGFSIGTNDLGTKGELKELCEEADKYGIKVIVDVVANHLADDENIQSDLKDPEYWHRLGIILDPYERYQVTHSDIHMPDINSENSYVQQVISNYINELKNIGVDGIRWDSAKNISLPSEGTIFWAGVTSQGLYHYGDLGNGPDDRATGNEKFLIEYTKYMSVTDGTYGQSLREAFANGTVPTTLGNWSTKGVEKNKLVYWGENHDTWSNGQERADFSNGMSQNVIDRAYAIAASQNGATALYFSRPQSSVKENIYAGVKGSTHFTSVEVTSINRFHNDMIGQKDAYATGDNCAVVGREKGAVVVAGSGGDFQVTVPNPDGLTAPGRYKDIITGDTWSVTATTMTGKVGSTGIAVLYGESVATVTPGTQGNDTVNKDNNATVVTEGMVYYNCANNWTSVYAYYWSNQDEKMVEWPGVPMEKVEGTIYCVNLPAGTEFVIFNDGNNLKTSEITLAGADKIYSNGKWSNYKPSTTQDETQDETQSGSQTIVADPVATKGAVFFKNTSNWSNVKAYYWSEENKNMCTWPGEDMIALEGNVYGIILPEGTEWIIFSDGGDNQTADIPLAGADKIYKDGKWSGYTGTLVQQKPDTQDKPSSSVTYEGNIFFKNTANWTDIYVYYWSSSDPKMTTWPGEKMNDLGNGVWGYTLPEGVEYVIFNDTSGAQTGDLELPGLNKVYVDNNWVEVGSENLDKPEQSKDKQLVYFNNKDKWEKVYAYYWSDANSSMTMWPGIEMEKVDGDIYSVEIPKDAQYIIFNNTDGNQTEDLTLEGANKIFDGTKWNDYN